MYLLSFFVNHNSGVALFKNGDLVFSIEEERLDREKYSSNPIKAFSKVLDFTKEVDVIVYNSTFTPDAKFTLCPSFKNENVFFFLLNKLGLITENTIKLDFHKYHHLIHAAGAFCRSGFDNALNIVVDGSGSPVTESSFETESCYFFDKSSFRTVFKRSGSIDKKVYYAGKSIRKVFDSEHEFINCRVNGRGIVKVYEAVTQLLGWSPLEAGKTMGLSSYGTSNSRFNFFTDRKFFGLRDSNNDLGRVTYPLSTPYNSFLLLGKDIDFSSIDYSKEKDLVDLSFEVQKQTQQELLNFILKCVDEEKVSNITLSGGYGLNVVSNAFLKKELQIRDINFFVDPLASDCGIPISAGMFYHNYILNSNKDYSINKNINFGFSYSYDDIDVTTNLDSNTISKTSYDKVSNLLLEGKSIALFYGKSENGPRALGNRSLLFNPSLTNGKELINRVKNRESFRPFAGSIKEEKFEEWFDSLEMEASPFMMYALKAKRNKRKYIPSIVHVDGTCRVQTVSKDQNIHLYKILDEFEQLSNIPILLNTSFNLSGQPLVENLFDALNTLNNSYIDYLYLPDKQILIEGQNACKS